MDQQPRNRAVLQGSRLVVPLVGLIVVAAGCGSGDPIAPAGPGPMHTELAYVSVDLEPHGKLPQKPGLPSGDVQLGGVSFRIGSSYLDKRAMAPVGRRFRRLHVLQATNGGGYQQPGHPKHEQDGVHVGDYVIHYEDGQQQALPLVYGQDLRDWWNWDQSKPTTRGQIVWTGENPAAAKFNVSARLYLGTWDNPYPEKVVRSIELVSANAKAQPFCLAMSLEGASEASATTTPPIAPSTPRPDPVVRPDIAEDQQRQKEEFEAQRLANDWGREVRAARDKRLRAFDAQTDELERVLIAAALKASDARDRAAQSRLAEERNKFAENRMQLPVSPEVRAAALKYAELRDEQERRLLAELNALRTRTPAQATREELRILDEEIASAETNLAQLAARKTELAAMPRPAASPASNTTATTPPPTARPDPPAATAESPATENKEKKEFLGPPPKDWSVTVDPPPEKFEFPAKLPYESLPGVRPRNVLYPRGQSAFVAVGQGQTDVEAYTVYDLRTGKVIGEGRGFSVRPDPASIEGPTLSPDGTYLALPDSFEKRIQVGNVRQRKGVATLSCSFTNPAVLFPSPDRLLAINAGSSKRASIWELPSGKSVLDFRLTDEPAGENGKALVSPGGKHLAHIARQGGSDSQIHFYDLTNGKQVGALKIEGARNVEPRISGIAFSPDGSELAAFAWGVANGQNLAEVMVCWDLATGRPIYQRILDRLPGQGMLTGANYSEPLQWFPDGQGWLLFQRYVVDRRAGAVVQSLKPAGEELYATFGTKVLDDRRVILSDAGDKLSVVEVQRTRDSKPGEKD